MFCPVRCLIIVFSGLSLVDPVLHCDFLVREEEANCFAFLWFVCSLCIICLGLCVLHLGRLCSVIETLPDHLLYHS